MEVKSALLELFVQYALPPILTALGGLAAWALYKLTEWLKLKGSESKFALVGARFTHFADIVVREVEVTVRPLIQKASADGKLTPEEIAEIRKAALDRLKQLAGENGIKELTGALGVFAPQVESYLSGLLESAVAKMRAQDAVVVPQ